MVSMVTIDFYLANGSEAVDMHVGQADPIVSFHITGDKPHKVLQSWTSSWNSNLHHVKSICALESNKGWYFLLPLFHFLFPYCPLPPPFFFLFLSLTLSKSIYPILLWLAFSLVSYLMPIRFLLWAMWLPHGYHRPQVLVTKQSTTRNGLPLPPHLHLTARQLQQPLLLQSSRSCLTLCGAKGPNFYLISLHPILWLKRPSTRNRWNKWWPWFILLGKWINLETIKWRLTCMLWALIVYFRPYLVSWLCMTMYGDVVRWS